MIYVNNKTGVKVEVTSKIGGDWEPVTPKKETKTPKKTTPPKEKTPAKED